MFYHALINLYLGWSWWFTTAWDNSDWTKSKLTGRRINKILICKFSSQLFYFYLPFPNFPDLFLS